MSSFNNRLSIAYSRVEFKRKRVEIVIFLCKLATVVRILASTEISYSQSVFNRGSHTAIGTVMIQGCKVDETQRLFYIQTDFPDSVFKV